MQTMTFKVKEDTTLLDFLLSCNHGKSRNYMKSLLGYGLVAVDGVKLTQFNAELKQGQTVEMNTKASNRACLPFPVIYEDDELIVIDKPCGMLSISTDKEKERTAYRYVAEYIQSRNNRSRIFIVHRLDRETSGLLLFAKNESLKLALQEKWSELAIHRGYTAVVEGEVKHPNGEIKSWLKQTKSLLVYSSFSKESGGKEAITHYKTIKSGEKYSLLEITLVTGRKNQIRVHMKDIGHPVVGDEKYGSKSNPLKRLGLHANLLVLHHPHTGKEMRFETEMPMPFRRYDFLSS